MGTEGDSNETTPGSSEADEVAINIRCSNGRKFTVRTSLCSTVSAFKVIVAQNCDVPADQQKLIYKGLVIKNDQTLQSYGLQSDHSVHMVRGFAPSQPTIPSGTTNSGTIGTVSGATNTAAPTENAAPSLGPSLFHGLGLAGLSETGILGAGLPDVEQHLTQNPNMIGEMMNMRVIQRLTNNPDLMRNLIMNNPQMREVIDRNPELAHILNDPSILRQTLETARNPELMREMMRNRDRAMSNIESSPEGFNMLRRMYENVQEPFLNATTLTGDGNNLNSDPFAALFGNQGTAGAQRGGSNYTSTGSDSATPNANPLPNPWSNAAGGTQTNGAPRIVPSGDARIPSLGGLSSLPESDPMFSGVLDVSMMTQLLQNPAVSQMIPSFLSNPQYMNQIFSTSPQLRAMSDSNPQLGELMQNPEHLRQLALSERRQQMLTLHQSLLPAVNHPQSNQDSSQTAGAAGSPNTLGVDMLMNMFGGLGVGGLTATGNTNVPLEELYATQLSQLQEMGFFDTQENIRSLQASHGNVDDAVERLLGNMGQ